MGSLKDRVEHGARLAAEATPGPWTYDEVLDPDGEEWRWIEPSLTIDPEASALSKPNAAFIAHWNPEFAGEVARELQRLWRVEEAAKRYLAGEEGGGSLERRAALSAVLANPAAEKGDG